MKQMVANTYLVGTGMDKPNTPKIIMTESKLEITGIISSLIIFRPNNNLYNRSNVLCMSSALHV
jgi:hypothetical protein